ncbi:MAG: hypothetical protein J6Y62_03940 [Clostridia bacterium]|nr:hypothetical protein [Clostridia bacterium]
MMDYTREETEWMERHGLKHVSTGEHSETWGGVMAGLRVKVEKWTGGLIEVTLDDTKGCNGGTGIAEGLTAAFKNAVLDLKRLAASIKESAEGLEKML